MSNPDIWKYAGKGAAKLRGRPQSEEHVRRRVESFRRTLSCQRRACARCREEFVPTSGSQRYCSGRCWTAVHRAKRDPRHRVHVSDSTYEALRAKFGDVCNICGVPAHSNSRRERLAVDHCHETGAIRGLLCHRCNTAIGLLKDSVAILQTAIEYISTRKE